MNLDFRLIELFNTLPNITDYEGNSFKSSYDFGTKEDLNRFLQSMKRENSNPYPLIWLITPYDEQPQDVKATFETEFDLVVATITDANLSNRERVKLNFDTILFPLIENIYKAFERSGFTTLIEKKLLTKYYNYTEADKSFTTDIWDAVKIRLKISYNNCIINNKINY